jgi:Ca-activated chloride channel family protein
MKLAAGFAAALLVAQPAFRVETRTVVLYATVQNSRGELVTNLDRSAFTVYEDGKLQPITIFGRDDLPVSLGLLVDNSGSMREMRTKVEAAALSFARASNPQDEMFVLNFADKPRIDVPFTSDVHTLEAGIARVDSIGGTALWDAVDMAETYLHRGTRQRKVLLIVTDGRDNASLLTLDKVLRQAQHDETVIDVVGLMGETPSAKKVQDDLNRLTERSGGVAYYPADISQVEPTVLDVARQIRSQYTIAYSPANQRLDGSYRKIRLVAAGREHFVVRTRPGYWATPPAP